MQRINREDQALSRWKNGGGTTRTLLTEPPGADLETFDWRISVARIEADGPFSTFVGIDRTLVLMRGEALELQIDGHPHVLHRPGEVVQFAGETPVVGRLRAGPTEDLNIMTRRGRYVAHTSLLEEGRVRGVVVGLSSGTTVNGVALDYGDVAWGEDLQLRGRAMHILIAPSAG